MNRDLIKEERDEIYKRARAQAIEDWTEAVENFTKAKRRMLGLFWSIKWLSELVDLPIPTNIVWPDKKQ